VARKVPKAKIKKAHHIAEAIGKGGKVRSPYAVGMAVATGRAKRKKKKRKKR
jgi:hypothetical protein